ncbi:homoserine dehydrogenase [Actinomycetaceae bacterium TAE3-ERU4]|nr:homoserine dehydrogenase [Actinomycetaceae bacterium TAE3-ERU4]
MKIGLLGHGTVGQGVTQIIDAQSTPTTAGMQVTKILTRSPRKSSDSRFTTDPAEFFAANFDVLIECAGGIDGPLPLITTALEHQIPVVSANKKLVATHYLELTELARKHDVRFLFEATVGGGIPWLRNLALIKQTDEIEGVYGIFNGTTNYLLDQMEKHGKSFTQALKQAQEKGYAEADPSDDLAGNDVAYKCALSANLAWGTHLRPEEIPAWGLSNVRSEDIEWGRQNGLTLKFVGQAKRVGTKSISTVVIPVFTRPDNPLSHVGENYNCGVVESSYLGKSSYLAQGAGSLPTAFAIVQDLVDLQIHGTRLSQLAPPLVDEGLNALKLDNSGEAGRFYLRSSSPLVQRLQDEGLKIAKEKQEGLPAGAVITEEITVGKLREVTSKLNVEDLFTAKVD